jgi:anti-repressor protein
MENVLAVSDTITAKETMTSVEIAEITGKRHDSVLRDIDNLLEQGVSLHNFVESNYTTDRGKTYRCFELTKKGCLILASGYDAVLREKIINRWEQLETEKRNGGFVIPQTLSQALMLAAKQAEQIEQQQKLLEVQKPKVEFFDSVADSKTAVPMNDVAKVLSIKGYGRNNLFEYLRNNKVLMNNNRPYQKYVDAGYFRVIEQHYQRNGEEQISFKTLVYQRGIDFIRRMLNAA